MKKTVSLTFLILACILAGALTGNAHAQGSNQITEQTVVTSLIPQDMPVEIDSMSVTRGEGRSILAFSIKTKEQVSSVDLTVIVYDAKGFAKAGEGWRKSVGPASSRNNFTIAMKTDVMPGDRIVLTAYNASGRKGAWKADPAKLVEAANAFMAGKGYSLPKALFTKNR